MYSSTVHTSATPNTPSSSTQPPASEDRFSGKLWRPYLDDTPRPPSPHTPPSFTREAPSGKPQAAQQDPPATATSSRQPALTRVPPTFVLAPAATRGAAHGSSSVSEGSESNEPQSPDSDDDALRTRGRKNRFPISREVFNGFLDRWRGTSIPFVYGTGAVRPSQLSVRHYAMALREQGIPLGKYRNNTLCYLMNHFKPGYSAMRSEPSLEGYDMSTVVDTTLGSRNMSHVFAALTRDGRKCTLARFLAEVKIKLPHIPEERARKWYYEESRPGQVIRWRTDASLLETSYRVLPSAPSTPALTHSQPSAAVNGSAQGQPFQIEPGWFTTLMRETVGWPAQDVVAFLRHNRNALSRMSLYEVYALQHDYAQQAAGYPPPTPIPGLDQGHFDAWTREHTIDGSAHANTPAARGRLGAVSGQHRSGAPEIPARSSSSSPRSDIESMSEDMDVSDQPIDLSVQKPVAPTRSPMRAERS